MAADKITLSEWKIDPEDLDFRRPDAWYKGPHCHRFPDERRIRAADIVLGWEPPQKLIRANTKVMAFGSCFAEYFVKFLSQRGYNRWQLPNEPHTHSEEKLLLEILVTFETIFVILQQFRWAFGEFTPESQLWFTKDKKLFEATEARRDRIRRSLDEVDVFVITLGLSEVWFDKATNEPMWRTMLASLYDPARHSFRRATVAETLAAFHELDRLAERHLRGKHFIFTLSPIPLIATFRNQSAVTANQVSKAVLRAALDEFICDPEIRPKDRYFYFPSYELAVHLFDNPFLPDNRHVKPEVASTILNVFSAMYTDIPVPETGGSGVDHTVWLEDRVRQMEQELTEKERVIRELDQAARERLEIINRLTTGPQK